MTGFSPLDSLLITTDEYVNLSFDITYTDLVDGVETEFPVTVTPQDSLSNNPTILVSGGTISGFYSGAFNSIINYRNKNDTFTTVSSFASINTKQIYGLVYFFASTIPNRTFSYVATANGQSKTYTIVVNNNWTIGRGDLIKYANLDGVVVPGIVWINNNSQTVVWLNTSGSTVKWTN